MMHHRSISLTLPEMGGGAEEWGRSGAGPARAGEKPDAAGPEASPTAEGTGRGRTGTVVATLIRLFCRCGAGGGWAAGLSVAATVPRPALAGTFSCRAGFSPAPASNGDCDLKREQLKIYLPSSRRNPVTLEGYVHGRTKQVCVRSFHLKVEILTEPFEDALRVPPPAPPAQLVASMEEQLRREPWYHGRMSRKEAEKLLQANGDFLVRESTTTPGQYVLTGLQGGQPKHLLLVDPEGVVRTKDHRFESVSHLISYHMDNRLPIISAGSELCLQQPVERRS
uniref:Uncharacterized protein n=1 Tax=Sphaerodactylus townsendi TaxID=933632 RepID=A0ACB8G8E1_9SAUR